MYHITVTRTYLLYQKGRREAGRERGRERGSEDSSLTLSLSLCLPLTLRHDLLRLQDLLVPSLLLLPISIPLLFPNATASAAAAGVLRAFRALLMNPHLELRFDSLISSSKLPSFGLSPSILAKS